MSKGLFVAGDQVLLTLPSLGADSAVFGAAELVLDPVLDHPFDAPQRRPATSAQH